MTQARTSPKKIVHRGAKHPYSLRLCVPGDEGRLALLGAATFLETYAGVVKGDAILAHCRKYHVPDAYRAWLESPDSRVVIAETDGAPVGYTVLCPVDASIQSSPGDIELRRIYLLHRFQGSGIGSAMMDWALRTARELGHRRLVLGVYPGNAPALRFYARCGFVVVGDRRFQVGDQVFVDPVLAKELQSDNAVGS